MPTFQDDFDNAAPLIEQDTFSTGDYIASTSGAEIEGGLLLPSNLDEGVCLNFGSGQYVDCGSLSAIHGISALTLSAWMYRTGSTDVVAVSKGQSGGNNRMGIILFSDGNAYAQMSTTSALAYGSIANAVTGWQHLLMVYDGSLSGSAKLVLYINGIKQTLSYSGTIPATVPAYNRNLFIGKVTAASDVSSSGKIDDVRLFLSALTAEQAYKVYSTGVNPSTPLGHWKLNDGSGVTATDSGSGGNNGDLTGHAPTWTTSHTSFYARRAKAISTDLIDGAGALAVNSFSYTMAKKPGGTELRLAFSSDGSTFKNANGDTVDNTGGYSFDGVNDVITVNATVAQLMSASTGSMSCWIRIKGPGVSVATAPTVPVWQLDGIISDTAGYAGIHFGTIGTAYESIYFYNFDTTSTYVQYRNLSPLYGQWIHLVWVHSGGILYGYLNGSLVGSTSSGNTGNTTGTIRIGCNWLGSGGSDFFDGDIDDIRIHNVGLSDTDVWELYSRNKDNYTSSSQRKLWLKLDGNATDSSGNGNDGSVGGATALSEFSSLPPLGELLSSNSNALDFDGVNDFITVTDASALRPANALTLSAWVYLTPASVGITQGIIGKYLAVGNWVSYRLYLSSTNQLVFGVHNKTQNKFPLWTSTAVPISSRQWCHVAVTYTRTNFDSTDAVIYFNGIPVSASFTANGYNSSFTIEYSAGQIGIGRIEVDTPTNYFYGKLANASLHSAALSAAQIKADFLNGYPSVTNLVAHWPVADKNLNVTADIVGGLNGTISGATWTKDSFRPTPGTPSQETIDIAGAALYGEFEYQMSARSENHDRAAAITEITIHPSYLSSLEGCKIES